MRVVPLHRTLGRLCTRQCSTGGPRFEATTFPQGTSPNTVLKAGLEHLCVRVGRSPFPLINNPASKTGRYPFFLIEQTHESSRPPCFYRVSSKTRTRLDTSDFLIQRKGTDRIRHPFSQFKKTSDSPNSRHY